MAKPNPWLLKDFSGGYIDGVDDNLLPDNASPDCLNVISPVIGLLEKRRGQEVASTVISATHPVNGLYAYYHGIPVIVRRLLIAAGGSVGYMSSGSFTTLKTGLSTTEPILFETCANYVVSFSGVNQPWKWDGTTVSNLVNAPVDGRFPTLFKEKLFVVPLSDPSLLHWSESLEPETWPGAYYWPVNDGDGDRITGLTRHLDEMVIFKSRSIWTFRGNWIEDFVLSDVTREIGCIGPRAVAQQGLFLYFVSSTGLYMYDGMQVYNLSEDSIPRLWARVNQSVLHKATVTSWRGAIWFSLPLDDSTYNDLVLAFVLKDRGKGSWWVWDGIDASCFEVYDDATTVSLYSGDATLGQIRKQDVGDIDIHQQEEFTLNLGGATGGTFTLGNGVTNTSALAYNVLAAAIEDALEVIYGVGKVAVAADEADFIITFDATVEGSDLEANFSSLTGATNPALTETQAAFKVISSYWVGKTFDMGLPEHEKKAKRMYLERSPHTVNYPELQLALNYGAYNSLAYSRTDEMIDLYRFTDRSRWRYLSPKIIPSDVGPCQVRGIYLPYKAKRRPKVRVVAP